MLLLLISYVFTVASSPGRMKMYANKARLKLKQLLTDIATRSLPCFQVLFALLPDTCDTTVPRRTNVSNKVASNLCEADQKRKITMLRSPKVTKKKSLTELDSPNAAKERAYRKYVKAR